jgi:hypothetical protein
MWHHLCLTAETDNSRVIYENIQTKQLESKYVSKSTQTNWWKCEVDIHHIVQRLRTVSMYFISVIYTHKGYNTIHVAL